MMRGNIAAKLNQAIGFQRWLAKTLNISDEEAISPEKNNIIDEDYINWLVSTSISIHPGPQLTVLIMRILYFYLLMSVADFILIYRMNTLLHWRPLRR